MFGFWPPVYQCNGYPHSSSQSPFLCICVCACVFFICICRLLRFTNVMVSGSSSHHHSSIWCPPTHQPTIGKTSHIFCHKFQIQLKEEVNMFFFQICFMSFDRDQSTEGILVQTFKRPTLAKWQKKRKGSAVRGRWPMFTSILLVKEERDHDLFIKKREGCLMGNWLEEESVRLPTSQIFRLLRWTEIWQLCEI